MAHTLHLPQVFVKRFSHPWKPMALYLPLGALMSSLSLIIHPRPFFSASLLILSGIFSWTLIEYLLHRFLFHLTGVKEPWRSLASGLHTEHHRTAHEAEKILAPPLSGLIFGTFVYFVFVSLTLSFSAAALLETGVFLGYLTYEWVHFGAHRFEWDFGLRKFLKHYHLRHHFKDPKSGFGVTSPLWDWVFRTRPS